MEGAETAPSNQFTQLSRWQISYWQLVAKNYTVFNSNFQKGFCEGAERVKNYTSDIYGKKVRQSAEN